MRGWVASDGFELMPLRPVIGMARLQRQKRDRIVYSTMWFRAAATSWSAHGPDPGVSCRSALKAHTKPLEETFEA